MIFLSHTFLDKALVEQIALPLAKAFGKQNVFYDSWSIQPGDGIIDKMNTGLENCKYFFYFVSQNSLQSNLVKLEWQSALYHKSKNRLNLIPVKIDNCMMPSLLAQIMYIDLFGIGLDTAIRQMIDIISENNTFRPTPGFQNIRSYIIEQTDLKIVIEFRAETYMEPQSQYAVMVGNQKDDLTYKALESFFHSGFCENVTLDNGMKGNLILLSRSNPTSPNFPFVIEIESKNKLNIIGTLKAIARDRYGLIPLIDKKY